MTEDQMKSRVAELESVLERVKEEFDKYGDSFPDGFDFRLFRFVNDAISCKFKTSDE